MQDIWKALYDGNADVVLTGHDHQYERFAPQNAKSASLDPARGIRAVRGRHRRAGASHGFGIPKPNSEVRNSDTYGVLKLTLHANTYDWAFVPEAGKTFTDFGSASCH